MAYLTPERTLTATSASSEGRCSNSKADLAHSVIGSYCQAKALPDADVQLFC